MTRTKVLVSLVTEDNDFQQEQAAMARAVARELNFDAGIVFAGNDSVEQSLQLVRAVQCDLASRPNAIVVEPVGTAMPQVAHAAAEVGIAWVVLNRTADYIATLRKTATAPIFGVSSDNEEIGRIQGEQFNKLVPRGGNILYVEGPSASDVTRERTAGMLATKRADIAIRVLRGDWTENSGHRAVASWLKLTTSKEATIQLVGCQNDEMALGARRAIEETASQAERERLLRLPFTGCDGLPKEGQAHVQHRTLAATIVIPPLTGVALKLLASALQTHSQPAEHTCTAARSCPPITELRM